MMRTSVRVRVLLLTVVLCVLGNVPFMCNQSTLLAPKTCHAYTPDRNLGNFGEVLSDDLRDLWDALRRGDSRSALLGLVCGLTVGGEYVVVRHVHYRWNTDSRPTLLRITWELVRWWGR
jgi:hypothetical protein